MIQYLIEFSLIHLTLMLIYWVFLSRERQYGRLRFFLIGASLTALIVPVLRLPSFQSLFISESKVTVFAAQLDPVPFIAAPTENTGSAFLSFVLILYFIITGWLLMRMVISIIYLVQLKNSSSRLTIHGIEVYRLREISGSFSFFDWIFVDNRVESNTKEVLPIIKHEHAHVRLGHSYDLVFFQLFRMLCWWLPSSWYALQEIKKIHEYQADAYALKSYSKDHYSSVLISSILKSNGLSLASSFHDGLILKRLKAMNQQMKKISKWKLGAIGVMTALLVLTFACNEELDKEIKKMGASSDAITFDQLPVAMQNELNDIQDKLSFTKVKPEFDENGDPRFTAEEFKSLDPDLIYSMHVNKESQEMFVALKKDGANFDYVANQSKSDDKVFTIVEEQPQFPGGMEAFYKYVAEEITYPAEARKRGLQGRAYVQFVVDTDGSVIDVTTVKGIGGGCDEEAERILREAPDFIPGKQRGQNVKVRMVLPVIFKLDGTNSQVGSIAKKPEKMEGETEPIVVVGYAKTNNEKMVVKADYAEGVWSGKVTNADGKSVSGVNIVIEGTSSGTITDTDGNFMVEASRGSELVLSHVGYESVKVKKQ